MTPLRRGMLVRLFCNPARVYEICAVTHGSDPKNPPATLADLRTLAPNIRWVRVLDVESRFVRTITESDIAEVLAPPEAGAEASAP